VESWVKSSPSAIPKHVPGRNKKEDLTEKTWDSHGIRKIKSFLNIIITMTMAPKEIHGNTKGVAIFLNGKCPLVVEAN